MSDNNSQSDSNCFQQFNLEWLLDKDDKISNLEFDEYFYDASDRVTLRK